ncbi:hypothetical protein SAM40697_0295 [Streptomyces ambofaciens]|uniref:Secreted protein n=2 Tax=Streptomyces ambofaciens TaxID=1889 RepID=A0ABM6ASQ8_STRAM|nr:hypothetical protein SAM40697_0295 [Streptomyces ambofaciens]
MAAAVCLVAVPTAAHADTHVSAQAYTQKCKDIGNGTLCIDITGSVGHNGVIGVGYWKHAGDGVEVRLGWHNDQGGGNNMSSQHHYLQSGWTTGTETWSTYLGKGCVRPILQVFGSTGGQKIPGEFACVPE